MKRSGWHSKANFPFVGYSGGCGKVVCPLACYTGGLQSLTLLKRRSDSRGGA